MSVAPGYVQFRTRGATLVVRLGDSVPTLSGGVGGWEAVPRPGRRPLTVWRGPSEPTTYTIPVLFDGFESDRSVEDDIRTLEVMAGQGRDEEPPRVEVEGALPHRSDRVPVNEWVIVGLEYGDALIGPGGHRVRQAVTVTLWAPVEDDRLARIKRAPAKPTYRVVKARPGDTFEKIAARELKLKRAGSRLARLNGKRSPDVKLRAGTSVRLPTADALRRWRHELGG